MYEFFFEYANQDNSFSFFIRHNDVYRMKNGCLSTLLHVFEHLPAFLHKPFGSACRATYSHFHIIIEP